jgi:hypothetical protein
MYSFSKSACMAIQMSPSQPLQGNPERLALSSMMHRDYRVVFKASESFISLYGKRKNVDRSFLHEEAFHSTTEATKMPCWNDRQEYSWGSVSATLRVLTRRMVAKETIVIVKPTVILFDRETLVVINRAF